MNKFMMMTIVPLALLCGNASAQETDCLVAGLRQAPQPCDPVLPPPGKMLSWDRSQRTVGFRNDYRNYAGDRFKHGAAVSPLPFSPHPLTEVNYTYDGRRMTLGDYARHQDLQALLILKDGQIVLETFYHGNTRTTLWTSRSVAKSVVSTLVGIAIRRGEIHSLDDLITRYEPDFIGTAWDGVTLKQLIQHTSGVSWNENYTDPHSDFSRLTRCEAHPQPYSCVYRLVHDLPRRAGSKPGETWSYSTGGAWLLGDVLEKATGKTLARNLQENIWIPFGMASDGVWHAYVQGQHDMGGHGFNATLEDWGRFGQYILQQGKLPDGSATLPPRWLAEAGDWTTAKNAVSVAHPTGIYGYQWWNNDVPANAVGVSPKENARNPASLWALGIYGQMIAINRQEHLVMVQWSTWKEAEPAADKQPLESAVFFNAVAKALRP